MFSTVILAALIICFLVITVFSLVAMLAMRRREKDREEVVDVNKAIAEMDKALNAALNEVNKVGALAVQEIDEKYKAMLFLYNLMNEKQKELAGETWKAPEPDGEIVSELLTRYIEAHGISPSGRTEAPGPDENETTDEHDEPDAEPGPPPIFVKRPAFLNPRHKQIWEMREKGKDIPEIAQELGVGQGEVKLILDLVDRAS